MVIFIFLIILVVAALLAIVLFGDLPTTRNSWIHRLHEYLTNGITRFGKKLKLIDVNYLGGFLTSHSTTQNLKWWSGWIIPISYLLIFSKSLDLFFKHTFAQLLNNDENNSWKSHYVFMTPLIISNYCSFILAVWSNPGYVKLNHMSKNEQSKLADLFPNDKIIFANSPRCVSCKVEKIPRSKHCSSCDRCVLMFDHHCIWLNNDVGYYTFRWFFMFLVSICLVFIYGIYLCLSSLQLYVRTTKLPQEIHSKSVIQKYWHVVKYTTFTNEVSGILGLLCVLLFPLVGVFLGQVLHSVYLGVTTNETAKWDYIDQLVQNNLLFNFIPSNNDTKFFLILDHTPSGSPRFIDLKSGSLFSCANGGDLQQVSGWEDLDNIYDKGFICNLKERLFPERI